MHDEAKLVKGSGKLAPSGDVVPIKKVERFYSSSSLAIAAETSCCSNSNCGVQVIAVITDRTKKYRKNSPSSYFRASPVSHQAGCKPTSNTTKTATVLPPGKKPASPTKAAFPTQWDDVSATAPRAGANSGSASARGGAGFGRGHGTSTVGSGASRSKSRRVERFASEWKVMTGSACAASELLASWNPGGTFASAFFDLASSSLAGTTPTQKLIFRGTVSKIHKGTTGYSLTLVEKHRDRNELVIWVQSLINTSGPSGTQLWDRLTSGVISVGAEVFALGEFVVNQLLIDHPHRDDGLLRAYERAFLDRRRQIFVIEGGEWRSRHDISPSSGGLTSILTDTAAVERFHEGSGAFASAALP